MSSALTALQRQMRACTLCADAGHDIVAGAVFSHGNAPQAMIIGQAPGVTEVEAKRPFNAGSGRRLFSWLGQAGWEEDAFRARHAMTAVTKCFPGKAMSGRGDRVPSRAEQAFCRPFLKREIGLLRPRLIMPVGLLAIRLFFPTRFNLRDLIGRAFFFDQPTLSAHDGVVFNWRLAREVSGPVEEIGRYIVPLPHPSGASVWPNKPANKLLIDRAIALLAALRDHLAL